MRVFEYSFLQGLAVTPNIAPAELRVFLNTVRSDRLDYCVAFMRKWMNFIKSNFHYWKNTWEAGNLAAGSKVEIYAHTKGDSGYICLGNAAFT